MLQQLDVLAGALLGRIAAGEQLTHPGEVLIDRATVAALGLHASLGEQRLDLDSREHFTLLRALADPPAAAPWVQVALPATALHPWVHQAIWSRHEAGLGAFLTELRRVVALFLRFGGIDFDIDDSAGEWLDAFIRRAQVVLANTGGSLLQLTVGDKGAYLYAAFGAPVAHEDDARRAARAALDLHALAADLGLPPFQIGLSQGIVRTGAYGGPTRQTYGALGDEVNVAARLMQAAAPGTTLATERVRSLAGDTLAWAPCPDLVLKGKTAVVMVSQLLGLRSDLLTRQQRASNARPMIGRRAELAQLETVLEQLEVFRVRHTVVIEGEAGLGKSQLALALLAQARSRSLRVLVGAGDAVEQNTPAFAWRAILSQLVGLDGLADALPARHIQLLAHLQAAGEPEAFAPLLNTILVLHLPETVETAPLTGAARAAQTTALVLRLLRRAADEQPLVILLEDIHWLDPTSWELLRRVVQQLSALIVLTTRPPEMRSYADYGPLLANAAIAWLPLGPLAAEELVPLLCDRLGVNRLAPEVAELILTRAEGNPYFSVELAAVLREAGLVHVVAGECQLAPSAQREDVTLPDTLQGVIGYRLDQLAPEEQLTVKVASVIGRVFAVHVLGVIHPMKLEVPQLRGHLVAAEQLNLALQETPEPALSYAFRHIIAQEVAYSLLPGALQRSLHEAVASQIEAVHCADLSPYALLLAHHWQRAEQPARARDYLDRAGTEALRTGAFREARALLEQAERLDTTRTATGEAAAHAGYEDPLRRSRRSRMLGEAYLGLGELGPARQQMEASIGLLGRPINPGSTAWLMRTIVRSSLAYGRQSVARLAQFGSRPAVSSEDVEAGRAYLGLSLIYTYESLVLPALYAALNAMFLLRPGSPSAERARALGGVSILVSLSGFHRQARAILRRARGSVERSGHLSQAAQLHLYEGLVATASGDWAAVEAALEAVIQIGESTRDWRLLGEALNFLQLALHYRGQFVRSLEVGARLEQLVRETANPIHAVWVQDVRGLNALRLGRVDEGLALLEQSRAAITQLRVGGPTYCVIDDGLTAAYLGQGRLAQAQVIAADTVQRVARPFPIIYLEVFGLNAIAEVALAAWEVADERTAHQRAARNACAELLRSAWIFPIGRPRAWRCWGCYERLAGHPRRARWALVWSLEAARRLGMPYEEALTHEALGLLLHGATGRAHLAYAAALYTNLDARGDLRRVLTSARR
jgi:class 3 adenylate cyclase/tetratricopeptide (TPR) repeat protein